MATVTQATAERPSGFDEVTIWLSATSRGGIEALAAMRHSASWSMLQGALNESCKKFLVGCKPVSEAEIAATFEMAPPANTKPILAWLPPELVRAVAVYAANSKRSFSDAAGLLVEQYFQTLTPESQRVARAGGHRAALEEQRKRAEPMRAFREKSAAKAREIAAALDARQQAEESLSESLAMLAHIAGRFEPELFLGTRRHDARQRDELAAVCDWLAQLRSSVEA
jgi:hypothetical protein